METTQFSNKIKIIQINIILKLNLIIIHKTIFHQMMRNTITKIINDFTPTKDLDLTVLSNQIFLNHTKMNKYDNLELTNIIQQKFSTTKFSQHTIILTNSNAKRNLTAN